MNDSRVHFDDGGEPHGVRGGSDEILSETGRSRRDAMLASIQFAVVREGRRRRVRRHVVRGGAGAALVLAVGFTVVWNSPTGDRSPIAGVERPDDSTANAPWRITILRTEPDAVKRLSFSKRVQAAEYTVGDAAFLAALTAIGRPAGLIRSRGSVRLTHAVTDAEILPLPDNRTDDKSGRGKLPRRRHS